MVVEFENDVADTVEEVAVVRHHEQRLVAALQIALKPFYHLEVEVVCRLVEDEQVGLGDEHVGERDALLLSAAELSHRLREVGDVQLREYLLSLQYAVGVALMVEASVEHRLFGVELWLLFEKADLDVAAEDDAARVDTLLAREQREQGRLARAVLGYQTYVLAFGYRERDVLEQNVRTERFRYVLNVK